ncbi:MAG: hypothetical protein ACREYE_29750, partial [Gammaproteobacteria bacterium]
HVSSGVRSAGCNLIATRVFGMSETIAITGKSVKLFKGHYTSRGSRGGWQIWNIGSANAGVSWPHRGRSASRFG